ncbi:MAG: ABC transporter ATP-binding protein [Bacillota bacterium]|nr:ABC transporter ATP-binding protein [Bacillota bacterium]
MSELLRLTDLRLAYTGERLVLRDIDLVIREGDVTGLIGESGSGKTTIARLLSGELEAESGQIIYAGTDITHLRGAARRRATQGMAMVFQDPYTSLDTWRPVAAQVEESLIIRGERDRDERRRRVAAILRAVGLDPERYGSRVPAELSGGQRQRVAIAAATVARPRLLIADEAVSALDIPVQAQILNLLALLSGSMGFACLFISHDLNVVSWLCDHVAVLHEGEIVEYGETGRVFTNPQHPRTQALVRRLARP